MSQKSTQTHCVISVGFQDKHLVSGDVLILVLVHVKVESRVWGLEHDGFQPRVRREGAVDLQHLHRHTALGGETRNIRIKARYFSPITEDLPGVKNWGFSKRDINLYIA